MLTSTLTRSAAHSSSRTHTARRLVTSTSTMSYRSALFTSAQYSTSREARDPAYRVLRNERMNKHVQEAQYAVRGAIPLRAEELRDHLDEHGENAGLPFETVVNCNIGNPQQLDQKPLTFLRQVSALPHRVLLDAASAPRQATLLPRSADESSQSGEAAPLTIGGERTFLHTRKELLGICTQADHGFRRKQVSALCDYPDLLDHPLTPSIFPSDAIARARSLISEVGSTGAYSHSMGNPTIRKRVAEFIESETRPLFSLRQRMFRLTHGCSFQSEMVTLLRRMRFTSRPARRPVSPTSSRSSSRAPSTAS